jgi:hypothetical protein
MSSCQRDFGHVQPLPRLLMMSREFNFDHLKSFRAAIASILQMHWCCKMLQL